MIFPDDKKKINLLSLNTDVLSISVLCFNSVTVAYGKEPPCQGLCSRDKDGHHAHQVEHHTVEALQGTGKKKQQLLLMDIFITKKIREKNKTAWLK